VILDEILASKRAEVAARSSSRPLAALEAAVLSAPTARGFAAALRQPGVRVIAEIKRKSPSGGELRPGASAADLAAEYAAHGAAALSVLTDFTYFGGSDDDLFSAREACGLPVLRKDFVVDAYQGHEARALGADAVLLIVRALTDAELSALLSLTRELGMDALVETHSAEEIQRALQAGARIVGVNNRDLDTLVTDPSLALRLRSLVPADCVYVAESGVSAPEQIAALREVGADAVLIGEALVRATDPGAKLRALVAAGSSGSGVGSALGAADGSGSSTASASGSAVRPGAESGSGAPVRAAS
jgi:indole-3-glycerol phosphate synthase